jgi:hypothetical protein
MATDCKSSTKGTIDMELRDYFAAQIISGIASALGGDTTTSQMDGTARKIYEMADALMKERA